MTDEERKIIYDIWAKAVETQMHFNEMCVKSRQLGLAFVAAALGVAIVLLGKKEDFSLSFVLCGKTILLHASVLIILTSVMALFAVRLLDLNVYHRMLRGAVTFGEDFEEQYMKKIFSLQKGMTQTISHYSRYEDANKTAASGGYNYTGSVQKSAEEKIKRFYNLSTGALVASAVFLFVVTNLK
jgi:hypothetical protein